MAGDGLTHANLTELYSALPPNWRSLGNSPQGRRSTVMVRAKEVRREGDGCGCGGVGRGGEGRHGEVGAARWPHMNIWSNRELAGRRESRNGSQQQGT
jgi:hypothetical protein